MDGWMDANSENVAIRLPSPGWMLCTGLKQVMDEDRNSKYIEQDYVSRLEDKISWRRGSARGNLGLVPE